MLLNFNKEFNEGQDRGLELLDSRFLSFVLIKFHKELKEGKDPDSKIQNPKNPKTIEVHQKFWICWIYTVFFWCFLDFSKKKNNVLFLEFRGFGFWKILKIQKTFFFDFAGFH